MSHKLILSNAVVNAEARALGQLLAGGYLRIYDGAQPSSPDKPSGGRLLAELRFNASVPEPIEGVLVFDKLRAEPEARATGRASWFRCLSADGTALFDGSVGTTDADLMMSTTQIQQGAEVAAKNFIHGIPKQ